MGSPKSGRQTGGAQRKQLLHRLRHRVGLIRTARQNSDSQYAAQLRDITAAPGTVVTESEWLVRHGLPIHARLSNGPHYEMDTRDQSRESVIIFGAEKATL